MAKVRCNVSVLPYRVEVYFRHPLIGANEDMAIERLTKKYKGEVQGSGSDFSSYNYGVGFSCHKDCYQFIKGVLKHYKIKKQDRKFLWFEVYQEKVETFKLRSMVKNEHQSFTASRGRRGYFGDRKTVIG